MSVILDGTTGINTPSISAGNIVGEVVFFAMDTAPTGWLKANGAEIDRTVYASLFSVIGTTYGAGDGSTTFNLPDLRGEFLRAWDDNAGVDSGRVFASAQSWAIENIVGELGFKAGNDLYTGAFASSGTGGGSFDNDFTGVSAADFDASRVVNTADETRPRNVALLACIKF